MADGHSAKCEVIILNMRILNAVVNKRMFAKERGIFFDAKPNARYHNGA